MSIATACGLALLRSLISVLLAVPLCKWMCRLIGNTNDTVGRSVWILLLLPFFFPGIITAYAFSNFSLSLIEYPSLNLGLYFLLITMKIAAAGTVVMYFSPPSPLSDEAIFCRRLGRTSSGKSWSNVFCGIRDWLNGSGRAVIPAIVLMFCLSFQEFEMASLFNISSWTVWLFDAQAGGLPISDSVYHALLPLACEAVILLPLIAMILKTRSLPAGNKSQYRSLGPWGQGAIWFYLFFSVSLIALIPSVIVLRGGIAGLPALLNNFSITKEILTGGTFALAAGALTYSLSAWLFQAKDSKHKKLLMYFGTSLGAIGLLGSLMVSLLFAGVFQISIIQTLYDTPLPWLSALVLYLLPLAIILQLLLIARSHEESLHLGILLKRSSSNQQASRGKILLLQLRGNAHFWSFALICYWAYIDINTASLLAPTGMVSAPVRLYNLMHYGQSAVLSATVCAAFLIPLFFLLFVFSIRRTLVRWIM